MRIAELFMRIAKSAVIHVDDQRCLNYGLGNLLTHLLLLLLLGRLVRC